MGDTRVHTFKEFYKNSLEIRDIDPNIWMSNYLVNRLEMNDEQILWFCFLNSITYHLPTAYMIFNEYPDLELIGEERLRNWWKEVQHRCPFQTDKLKQRKYLPDSVISYQKLVGKSQKEFFDNLLSKIPEENFDIMWNNLYKNIDHFGRFSTWNWIQMLKQVAGYNITPSKLFLGESNAESHTHGLCYALGKDEWAKKEYVIEDGKRKKRVHIFSQQEKQWLEEETKKIQQELNEEGVYTDPFTLETVACAYKKLFRERESRYVGYYLDRQAEDIRSIENNGFDGVDWSILWDARNEMLKPEVINDSINKKRFKDSFEEKIKFKTTGVEEWL